MYEARAPGRERPAVSRADAAPPKRARRGGCAPWEAGGLRALVRRSERGDADAPPPKRAREGRGAAEEAARLRGLVEPWALWMRDALVSWAVWPCPCRQRLFAEAAAGLRGELLTFDGLGEGSYTVRYIDQVVREGREALWMTFAEFVWHIDPGDDHPFKRSPHTRLVAA